MDADDPRQQSDPATRSRCYAEEVQISLSALDTVLHGEKAVYASSELTTGRRLYELFHEHGVTSRDELRRRLGEDHYRRRVWDPYVQEASALATALRTQLLGELVVTPAPFTAPGWTQAEYLGFWETVIRTRIRAVYLSTDWEYSNGCTFEFVVAHQAGVPTFDEQGAPLWREEGQARIARAIADLAAQGFEAPDLATNLRRLAPGR